MALLAWLAPLPAFAEGPLDRFTVCLVKSAPKVEIKGKSCHFFDEELEGLVHQSEGMRTHAISVAPEGIAVDGKVFDTARLRVRSTENWLSYGGRIFREDLIAVRLPDDPTRLALVNEIQLEGYLYGLINKEALKVWPLEAKKAQAVAARTYALHKKINHPKDVCDLDSSALDQVYGGYSTEDQAARLAVDATRGEVLVYGSRIAKAFYHSTCGGKTASSEDVWGDPQPYLPSLACTSCAASPSFRWEYSLTRAELAAKLGAPKRHAKEFVFDIVRRDSSGRVVEARVRYGGEQKLLSGEDVRRKLGYQALKSSAFTFAVKRGRVTFSGKGFGHGVGMCQWGAAGMAAQGEDYRAILHYYYPGTMLRKIY